MKKDIKISFNFYFWINLKKFTPPPFQRRRGILALWSLA